MALLIGAPGAGKTLGGASFSEIGPMSFADFDGRMKPVTLYYPKAKIHYTSYTVQNAIAFVERDLPALVKNCPYKSFQLAGITSLSTALITAQMQSGGGIRKGKGGIFVPSWDEFSGESMLIGQALDMLRALPCNVFVEAHPISRTSLQEGKYSSLVAFGPKVASLIPGYFDEIWYFSTETDISGRLSYVVHCKPSSDWPLAKTSLPLPDKFVLSDELGRPKSLYQLIQNTLNEYSIEIGGTAQEPEDEKEFPKL